MAGFLLLANMNRRNEFVLSAETNKKLTKIYETISFKILDLRQPREMGNKQGKPYDCPSLRLERASRL